MPTDPTSAPPGPAQPVAPHPLALPVVDNHTHLDHTREADEPTTVDDVIAAAAAVNVTRMVQIGCDLPSARWTVEAVDTYPQLVGGVALHPTEATTIVAQRGQAGWAEAFAEIEQLAQHPRIRVIGETGLDHHWVSADDPAGRAAQVESFRAHIDLAKRLDKVMQIHDRDAHDAVLAVLADEGAPAKTVFHCFSGDADLARFCVDQGWYLSFAGTITFKNAAALRAALKAVGPDQVLVETDAPYLAPSPHRGRPNASSLMPLTVRCMAEVLELDETTLCARLDATSRALYGPW